MNRFEYEGKTYVAHSIPDNVGICHGCAFRYLFDVCTLACSSPGREDGFDIIWVEEDDE